MTGAQIRAVLEEAGVDPTDGLEYNLLVDVEDFGPRSSSSPEVIAALKKRHPELFTEEATAAQVRRFAKALRHVIVERYKAGLLIPKDYPGFTRDGDLCTLTHEAATYRFEVLKCEAVGDSYRIWPFGPIVKEEHGTSSAALCNRD